MLLLLLLLRAPEEETTTAAPAVILGRSLFENDVVVVAFVLVALVGVIGVVGVVGCSGVLLLSASSVPVWPAPDVCCDEVTMGSAGVCEVFVAPGAVAVLEASLLSVSFPMCGSDVTFPVVGWS